MTTKSAVDLLQEQIEAVRREAFAAGYEAAMALIREAASRPAPDMAGPAPAPAPSAAPPHRRRRRAAAPPARPRRGANAELVAGFLRSIAPRAARPAEIRSGLRRERGVVLAYTSIRQALGQLEARRVVEQVADSKTWRHLG
jgi:hypothetical protein